MFKVGDIVVGTSNEYSTSGKGSICRVMNVLSDEIIQVEVMTPAPRGYPMDSGPFKVYARHFKLRETKPMKIEALSVFHCQRQMNTGEECGELAQHRVTVPGLSLTFCTPHARGYLKGEESLEVITCTADGQICKPGYRQSRDSGYPFCTEECEQAYMSRGSRAYASASPY